MAIDDKIRELIEPAIDDVDPDVELIDVEYAGGILRVTLDAVGGIAVGQIQKVSRAVNALLDEHDPIAGAYSLEVSSPGVERRLRRPEHFTRAVGEVVSVKLIAHAVEKDAGRRFAGELLRADAEAITVDVNDGSGERTVRLDDIDRAKTVFDWGPSPKPGKGSGNTRSKKQRAPKTGGSSKTASNNKPGSKNKKNKSAAKSTSTGDDQTASSQSTRAGTP